MYQVLVERSAEKDLKRLSAEIRTRVAAALPVLAKNPRPAGSRKLAGTENDCGFAWVTIALFTRSPMRFASCALTEFAIDGRFIGIDKTERRKKVLAGVPMALLELWSFPLDCLVTL